jgi:hypothetical protein
MKTINYLFTIICIELVVALFLLSSCGAPVKNQQQEKLQKVNSLQNSSAEATTSAQNHINSGNLTDSTRTDTGGR